MNDPLDPESPLTVIVTEGRWDCFDYVTPRNQELVKILTEMGGVSESVTPGTYHFNVKWVDGEYIATLDPA